MHVDILSTCPSSLLSCMEFSIFFDILHVALAHGSSIFDHIRHLADALLIFTATGQAGSGDSTWPEPQGFAPLGSSFMALKCKLFTVVHHISTLFAISPVSGCPGNIHSHWPVVWWPSTWYHRWKWLPWLLARRLWKATSSIFVSTHNWKHSPVFFPVAQYKLYKPAQITYDHLWSIHPESMRTTDPLSGQTLWEVEVADIAGNLDLD